MGGTTIKNELVARIGAIDAQSDIRRAGELAHEIDAIRRLARGSGMRAAVAVAQALETALARGERGPLIHGRLALLSDAVRGDRHDDAACDAYRAACSVRLFG